MASVRLGGMEATVGKSLLWNCEEQLTDGQLLEQYAAHSQEMAFATLVHRYGPLVLGVCKRILQDEHEAEDAFQATFLVLARKANSLDRLGSLGSWLYAVACRTALKARATAARRRAHEREFGAMPAAEPLVEEIWSDLKPVLDEELNGLPQKYRAPLVLCILEGKTHQQAAQELGWPSGSMSRRIQRARDLLRERLARRGIVLSAALLLLLMTRKASATTVPAHLESATVQAALAFNGVKAAMASVVSRKASLLAEDVLHVPIALRRLMWGLALLLLLLVGAGVNAFVGREPVKELAPLTHSYQPAPAHDGTTCHD